MGEATAAYAAWAKENNISIHASRGGSDHERLFIFAGLERISIHASRGGSDGGPRQLIIKIKYFNPRFPWGKRPFLAFVPPCQLVISIHASRGGSDFQVV